jgi:hypothetical protein
MTLNVMYGPACDARGKPGVGVRNGAAGSVILAAGFLVGVRWGPSGMALAWLAAYPLYLAASSWWSLPVIGASARAVAAAILPVAIAAIAMALAVRAADAALPAMASPARLAALVAIGGITYAAWLAVFARQTLGALVAVARGRQADWI